MCLRAVVALCTMLAVACSDDEVATACWNDGDCDEGRRCHPTARICVASCASDGDCPGRETCVANVCACNPARTDACGGGLTCHPEDRLCTERCREDCRSGRVCCDVGETRLCVADAGFCAGVASCGSDRECEPLQRCDLSLDPPVCVSRATCHGGTGCDASEECNQDVDPPTCQRHGG